MKQQIENIIKKNLTPTGYTWIGEKGEEKKDNHYKIYESSISLIVDEVLKVVVEFVSKIDSEKIAISQRDMDGKKYDDSYTYGYYQGVNKVKQLLSEHISPNKENE